MFNIQQNQEYATYFEERFNMVLEEKIRGLFRRFGVRYLETDLEILRQRCSALNCNQDPDEIEELFHEYIAEQEDVFGRTFEYRS